DAVRREVASNGAEQGQPGILRRVDERAHEQHAAECAPQIEVLNARQDRFGALDELEHLGVDVDGYDSAAETDQWMRDPAGAAAELEDLGVFGDLAVDELRLVSGHEQAVEVDRRARVAHEGSVADGRTPSVSP